MKLLILIILAFSGFFYPQSDESKIKISDNLEVIPLTKNAYMHVSFTDSKEYGRFTDNGLIYFNNNESVIFDTPPDDELSKLLLNWMKETFPEKKIVAVVVNHFHNDCLGGLNEFHKAGIKSYSFKTTPELAAKINMPQPQKTFSDSLIIPVGKSKVICKYFGEAHSKDNIVAWIPDEKILFGGCMVKSLNSGKGNLANANIDEWANTVSKVKIYYKDAQLVLPGHGTYGRLELLDYTIKLFEKR